MRITDTSAAEARRGKDIQGIPWDRLQVTRQEYRKTRVEQYKNYENFPNSSDLVEKVCLLSNTSNNLVLFSAVLFDFAFFFWLKMVIHFLPLNYLIVSVNIS